MYGVAQGRTRQWLRELAKENGVPYFNYTPPGAETTIQVRERAITFFQQLCQDLLEKFGTKASNSLVDGEQSTSLANDNICSMTSRSVSLEHMPLSHEKRQQLHRQRSSSTGNLSRKSAKAMHMTHSCRSSIDSALDLSSLSSDQQSISSSSLISRNSSFEKQRSLFKSCLNSPYKNNFSDLDILLVSHGGVIRELIKYFACNLQTDIGQHFDTIQNVAPNTSITRFQVTYSINDNAISTAALELIDYHSKQHLIHANNDEYNLDVVNKCSL
jgi:hypothetical protein